MLPFYGCGKGSHPSHGLGKDLPRWGMMLWLPCSPVSPPWRGLVGAVPSPPSLPCVPAITLAQFNTAPPWPPLATQPIGWPPRKLHGWTSSSSFCLHPEHVSDLFRTPLMARAACGSLFVCRVSGLTPTAEGLLPHQCSHGTSKTFAFFYPFGSRILFSILCYQFEVFYLSLISS